MSVTSNTRFAKNFIRRKLFSTLDSGRHQTMIQECEQTQKLKIVSSRFPPLCIKNTFKMYIKYTKLNSITKKPKDT